MTGEGRTGSTSYSASYTVDGEGNRTSQTVGGVTRTFAYDTDDALLSTSVGGTITNAYSYNGNGEQTGRTLGSVSYTLGYDGEGQMVSLTDGTSSGNKSYEYDALGRRASRTAGGTKTEFVRVGDTNGGQVLQEVQGTTVTASYTYGNALIGKGSEVNLYDGQGARPRGARGASQAAGCTRASAASLPAEARTTATRQPRATAMTGMRG